MSLKWLVAVCDDDDDDDDVVCVSGLKQCVKMKMKVAEHEFEVTGSSLSPGTFAPEKARLNKLHQVVTFCCCHVSLR